MATARRLISLLFLNVFALQSWAAVTPLAELERVPANEDEDDLWTLAAQHENNLIESGRTISSPHVEAYLGKVTEKLVGNLIAETDIQLEYVIVADTDPRAWVYPYGTVVVHTGLLASLDNEAQLAAVLAHELTHFLLRHAYTELVADPLPSMLTEKESKIGILVLSDDEDSIDTATDATGRFWTDLAVNGFSRSLEFTADTHALRLMSDAGYETNQASLAWEQIDRNTMPEQPDITLIWSIHHRPLHRIKSINAISSSRYYKSFEVPGQLPYYEGVAPALVENAALELKAHFYDRARLQVAMYLGANPDDPRADFLIGESWRLEYPVGPDFSRRLSAYERALEKDRRYAPAWKELGMYYRFHGQFDLARDAYNKYLLYGMDTADAGIIRGYLDTMGQTNAQNRTRDSE